MVMCKKSCETFHRHHSSHNNRPNITVKESEALNHQGDMER